MDPKSLAKEVQPGVVPSREEQTNTKADDRSCWHPPDTKNHRKAMSGPGPLTLKGDGDLGNKMNLWDFRKNSDPEFDPRSSKSLQTSTDQHPVSTTTS